MPELLAELRTVRSADARCGALLEAVCANFDQVALGPDAAWGADHRAAAASADAAKHAARGGRGRAGAAAPPPVPDDAFVDYTYRRRRPDSENSDRDGDSATRVRADIETFAKRPSLGPGASPARGGGRKLDKGSGGEIVLEGLV
jgi:hypothetical protein